MDIETAAKVVAIFASGFSVGVGASYHWGSRRVMESCRAVIAEREQSRQARTSPPAPEARPEPPPNPPKPSKPEQAAPAVREYHMPTKIGSIATLDGCYVYVLSVNTSHYQNKGQQPLTEYRITGRVIADKPKGGN